MARDYPPPSPPHHASWLPRDVAYSLVCENMYADHILKPDFKFAGVPPAPTDVDLSTLPRLELNDLPLSPFDPIRKFPSAIPGINLTHPGGYLEGGPGIDPSEDEFARHFISEHGVRTPEDLATAIHREIEVQLGIARERALARRAAREKNDALHAEIRKAEEEMKLEKLVLKKARERMKERRERKEKRRAAR